MSHTTPITIQNVRFYDMMIIWQTVPLRGQHVCDIIFWIENDPTTTILEYSKNSSNFVRDHVPSVACA